MRHGLRSGTEWAVDTVMTARLSGMAVVLLLAMAGCKGGLSGRTTPERTGLGGDVYVYNVSVHPNARSNVFVRSSGVQTPMFQGAEEEHADGEPAQAYVTTPSMPARGGRDVVANAGKFNQTLMGEAANTTAEADTALAAAMQTGVEGSLQGQGAAPGLRGGTGGAEAGPQGTNTPTDNRTLQAAPVTPISAGGGTAQVTNPTATQAGPGSTPGAVTGGAGSGTQGGNGTDGTQGTDGTYELVTTVTPNPDGTKTVTTDQGHSYTGAVSPGVASGGEKRYVVRTADGVEHRIRAAGENAARLDAK